MLALGKYDELEARIPKFQVCFDRFGSLILPFAENSPYIMRMIKTIVQKNPANTYYNNILSVCRNYEKNASRNAYPTATLSAREIDILSGDERPHKKGNGGALMHIVRNGKDSL